MTDHDKAIEAGAQIMLSDAKVLPAGDDDDPTAIASGDYAKGQTDE